MSSLLDRTAPRPDPVVRARRRSRRPTSGHAVAYVSLGIWVAFTIVALGWIILASFSTSREIFTNQLVSSGLQFDNYVKALSTNNLALYFLNSLLYILPSLVLIIVISAPAAYVLSRFEFRGRRVVSGVLISG